VGLENLHTHIVPYVVRADLLGVDVVQVVADVDELAEGFPVVGLLLEFLPIEMMGCS
jgi:hypothetical protein